MYGTLKQSTSMGTTIEQLQSNHPGKPPDPQLHPQFFSKKDGIFMAPHLHSELNTKDAH